MNPFTGTVYLMRKNRGIAFRLGAPVLVGSAVIFLVIFGTGYLHSRETILRNVEKDARNLGFRVVYQIESVLAPVEKMAVNLAMQMEEPDVTKERLLKMVRKSLLANPEIFGSAVAFEPYGFDPSACFFAPYFSRKDKEAKLSYLGGDDYRYFYHEWYQIPKETGKPSWSEPYFDEGGGNIPMVTFSVPLYRERKRDRHFIGVVTADISLLWLEKILSSMRIYQTGYGFILSPSGTFITHPQKSWIMNETIFSIAEARGDTELRRIGKQMIQGESGYVRLAERTMDKDGFLFFAPIGYSDWSLGIFFPEAELMAELHALNCRLLLLAAGGLLLLALVVLLVARTITRPLTALTGAARQMATGDLRITVPSLHSGGEVGVLANSFEHMKNSLNVHIKGLLETTAAKERMESELNIARDIQMSLLPKIFPPFPDVPEFDLFALLQPAREVGGDLYDFYRIDDERVCFVLGDVSGKGVPASLFMAVTMTLIKMTAAKGLSPDGILQEVNAQLSRDNSSCMFVTLFCGILNTASGEVWYANGGHNPPVLLRNTKKPSFLPGTDGMLLGAMEDVTFAMKRLALAPGESLLLYSDGVTEAMDEQDELYSEERLLELLNGLGSRGAKETVGAVMESVLAFAGKAPQADDITLMMIRYCGPSAVYPTMSGVSVQLSAFS